jgi:hypothetical protein
MSIRAFLVFCLAAIIAPLTVFAGPLEFKSSDARVSLLELYTSEGCNSCPPADRFVNELKSDSRLWREVIPVAFHVDYWDYIGWRDRFASPRYAERQRNYARRGYVKSVYTPGLVLGGEEWRSWFFSPTLKLGKGADVGPLRLTVEDGKVTATFVPATATSKPAELNVAVLGFGLKTDVKAGENSGKTLEHDFVVLGYGRADMHKTGKTLSATTTIPEARFKAPRQAIAAWVSAKDDPFPVQAVGGWLEP